ncbi:LysR family transcriptional regulator [Rhodovastum atsumiense]|uniref:LysR family transcriptional regulator n=1 Tax=Rhodovastum atsumiense TaxID=504468 RepID=A0A5M6ISK0_9PROT|nr:LysR family transcriptional regulator [Rhodovastum atsumiense]KAA5611171.1 LysR family transcriptional regulator [Rhodovastum atsumiense]CAH2602523.1 LysR family transcriptional regulator [Rhodovastum atsumiense]
MDRIDAMRLFTRVVERGSFIRAAEDLDLPASTATDAVKRLEARLGVRLLQRTTRHVRATPDGEAYYRRCLSILDDIEDAESAFSGARPRGLLRVDVQGSQARRFIVPSLPRFFAAYPDIELSMSEGDRLVDLVREGIDCVLRASEPKDSDLVARRLATVPEATVASAGYVARFGRPRRWNALEGHRMIGFRSSATGGVLPLEFMVKGVRRTVMLPSVLSVNGADTYIAAARQGLGLIQVPRYSVEPSLGDGTLVECLPETPPSPTSVYVLYPRSRQLSLRVRVFIDWIAKEYAGQLGAP